jgi:hypothetical protein
MIAELAMDAMKRELDAHPELGCLGSEDFVSARQRGTTTLMAQYWGLCAELVHLAPFAVGVAHEARSRKCRRGLLARDLRGQEGTSTAKPALNAQTSDATAAMGTASPDSICMCRSQ